MKRQSLSIKVINALACVALIVSQPALAASKSTGSVNAGGGNVGTGNSGNGVGNTGPGNQGNTSMNGNAGGSVSSGGGGSTGSIGNTNAGGGNVGTGNSGNGVGNTGPGNQGNTSMNGNAGGSMSSGGGGGSTGSIGNTNAGGGNVGTGNSGNGVGNTGPGNQGNDKTNGNAGGVKNNNGGNNGNGGNTNAGGDSGGTGNNGNGVGNTGPGNQGNDKANGNAGGEKAGDSGSGGNSGNNGNTNSGGDSGGTGNNGDTGGGKDSNNNKDTKNSKDSKDKKDSEASGSNSTTQKKEERKAKRSLKAKIDPLFNIDYDYGTGIIAVRKDIRSEALSEDSKSLESSVSETQKKSLFNMKFETKLHKDTDSQNLTTVRTETSEALKVKLTKDAPLYLKTSYELLEGGIGAAAGFYFENATGIASQFWAQVGLMPMKGTEISSVRYFKTLVDAKKTKGYTVAPMSVTELYKWEQGENVSFKSKGGIAFIAGTGIGLMGLTSTSVAMGTWETYVEKVDASRAYVKITKSKLEAFSKGAGSFLASMAVQKFENSDDGFSYLVDLQLDEGRKVYQDLLRGNVIAAQIAAEKIAKNPLLKASVQKVESFKRISKGKGFNVFFGLPIFLNAAAAQSKIQTFSTTDLHIEDSRVNAQFGIYDFTTQTRAFGNHTTTSRGFYGVRYTVADIKTGKQTDSGEMGRFSWMYQSDNSSKKSISRSLEDLMQQTGLKSLRVSIPEVSADMDFSNISLNISMNAATVEQIGRRMSGMTKEILLTWTEQRIQHVISNSGMGVCVDSQDSLTNRADCETSFKLQTQSGIEKMKEALEMMAQVKNDDVKYTKAFAEFGKAAMSNQVTLQMALSMASRGVQLNFAIEGTFIDPVQVNLETTSKDGEYIIIDEKSANSDQTLDPQFKRSRFYGMSANKNLTGLDVKIK